MNEKKEDMQHKRFGLFYQLNRNNEYILLYSHLEEERSLDEWIEIFSSNVYLMMCGRYSVWTVDEHNIRINKIIDNHELKNLLDNNKPLRVFLLLKAKENTQRSEIIE